MTRTRPGQPTTFLLRAIVAMMPPSRREWGLAMRAELAALDARGARRSFVFGCLRAALLQTPLATLGRAVASAAAIGGTVALTADTSYLPLRLALIAYVALLVAIIWAGRFPALSPSGPRAGYVRTGGVALLTMYAAGVITALDSRGDPTERATTGVPILTAVTVAYLVALIVVTARYPAGEGSALVRAAVTGVVAGMLWTAGVLLFPPVPAGIGAAAIATVTAAVVALFLARAAAVVPSAFVAAVLVAAETCAIVIRIAVNVIGTLASVRFIPLLPEGNGPLTQAARIAQSRTEMNDPYVAILFLGALAAMLLTVVSFAARRPSAMAASQPLRD